MLIPESYQNEILAYAFRYSLGRMTYAPHTVVSLLKKAWPTLPSHERKMYKKEITEAINNNQAGHDVDKRAWLSILSLED